MATVPSTTLIAVPTPKNTLIVAQQDGRLYSVDFSDQPQLEDPGTINWDLSVSKLILGKVQQTRTRFLTLEELEFENVVETAEVPSGYVDDMQITIFSSLDGKNVSATSLPTTATPAGGYVKANCRITAKNFSIQLRGTYNINTIILTYHNSGKR